MKRIISAISFLLLQTIILSGQNDPAAVKILDRFSSKALGATALLMKFNIINADLKENKKDTTKGSVLISRDKYRLDLENNIVWSDGVTSWSYLLAEKEVTINKIDKKDKSLQNRPSEVFTMYKKGYKNRLVEERPDTYIIDLYPEDINSDLQRVRLSIGKTLLNLKTAEYKRKDGVVITLVLTEYNLNQKPDPDGYIFKPEKYKGVEIIDMR
jgi:outer membrane lipoprotein carrier protein